MNKNNRNNKKQHLKQSSEDIEPWKEESSHLPQRFLALGKSNKKCFSYKNNVAFLKLYQTDKFSAIRNLPEQSPPNISNSTQKTTFKSCINFSRDNVTQMNSNLKFHLSCTALQRQTVIVARKKTKRGLEIKSLKRQVLNSNGIQQNQEQNLSFRETRQIRSRVKTEYKLRANSTSTQSCSGFDILVKQINVRDKKKKEQQDFICQIAAISNQKNRIINENKYNPQIRGAHDIVGLQSQLFFKRNLKFKRWFENNRNVLFSGLLQKTNINELAVPNHN